MPQGGALSECRVVHYPNAGSKNLSYEEQEQLVREILEVALFGGNE